MLCRLHARLPCPSAPAPPLCQSSRFSVARRQPASVGQPRQQRGFRCRGAAEPDSQDGVLRPPIASATPPHAPCRQREAEGLSHCTCAGGKTSVSEPDVVIRPPALDKEVRLKLASQRLHRWRSLRLDHRLSTAGARAGDEVREERGDHVRSPSVRTLQKPCVPR